MTVMGYSHCIQGNVRIHGWLVDRLKLQSAKLHSDPSRCALQLMGCRFSIDEMVNGNPSGVTKSKDECRKKTIKRLEYSIFMVRYYLLCIIMIILHLWQIIIIIETKINGQDYTKLC